MLNSKLISLFFLAAMLVSACATDSSDVPSQTSDILKNINSTSDIWVSDKATNLESSEVLIILQGGPRDYLYYVKDGRTLSRYLPGYKDRHVIYLHQAQTLNPDLFSIGKDFSVERARAETAATTEILRLAINHFKENGKKVTVIGHSYGAFTVIDYLANHESKADNYIVTAGRIAVPKEMVADNSKGYSSQFMKDGKTYVPVSDVDLSDRSAYEQGAYHVRALLKAAYGEPSYDEELRNRDLSNVVFVTGNSDQQVGTLTPQETLLLEHRGARVIYVKGGHYDVYKRMIDNVRSGVIDY